MKGVGMQYGNEKPISIGSTAGSAILDSGTSYILLPTDNYMTIKNNIAKRLGLTFTHVSPTSALQFADCTKE